MRRQRPVPEVVPFTSKEDYLSWLLRWREEYREISQDIRFGKGEVKIWQRESRQGAGAVQAEVADLRSLANEMMLDRDEAKVLARAHYIHVVAHREEEKRRLERIAEDKAKKEAADAKAQESDSPPAVQQQEPGQELPGTDASPPTEHEAA